MANKKISDLTAKTSFSDDCLIPVDDFEEKTWHVTGAQVYRFIKERNCVLAATTANITLSGNQTVDGVALINGDRCLVKDQSAPAENGIYNVAGGAWTRATDMDAWLEVPGTHTVVQTGTSNADSFWLCTSNAGGTLNTTAITFIKLAGPQTASRAMVTDSSGFPTTSAVTATELGYSSGLGSAIQTQLNAKQATITQLPIANGGTGQASANAALNALLPSQTGKSGKYLKTDGTDSAWNSLAGGSGEINAISNPFAGDGVTGVTAGTTHTVAAVSGATSPLNPAIATAFDIQCSAHTAESSTSGIYWPIATMPAGLLSKKLKVEFYVTVPSTDVWRLSVYAGSTRLALSTDVSAVTTLPAGFTGKFTAYFDTTTATAYSVNITCTTRSGSNHLYVTNMIVGPGIQPQGAVVTGWTSFTPTISGVSTSASTGNYRRSGNSIHIVGSFTASGSSSATVLVTLPLSLTIDSTALPVSIGNSVAHYGSAHFYVSGTDRKPLAIYPETSTQVGFTDLNGTKSIIGATDMASGNIINYDFTIPISEWAGSGVVNLAQNDVEYAFNTAGTTAAGGSDTTSFGYGPAGAAIGSIASTTVGSETAMRCRFTKSIQVGDQIFIEVNTGDYWHEVTHLGNISCVVHNSSIYGISYRVQNATDVDVYFGNKGRNPSGATYGADGGTWAGITTWRWRLKKVSGGSAAGFGKASATSLGLVTSYAPSLQSSILAFSADTTITTGDGYKIYLGTTGASTKTLTLPDANTNIGREIYIEKVDSGAGLITVVRAGSDTIHGATSATIDFQYESLRLVSVGSASWIPVSRPSLFKGRGTTSGFSRFVGFSNVGDENWFYVGTGQTFFRKSDDSANVGKITAAGAWQIGATSGTQTHFMYGAYDLRAKSAAASGMGATDSWAFGDSGGTGMFLSGSIGSGITSGESTANSVARIRKDSVTNRSLNASGTLNASGADYAEYMLKENPKDEFLKGEICGVNTDGKLTKNFKEAISFVVKSTDPSYVGGDSWNPKIDDTGIEDDPELPDEPEDHSKPDGPIKEKPRRKSKDQKMLELEKTPEYLKRFEESRQAVDRIAFAGVTPIIIKGSFNVGDYVIAENDGNQIEAVAVSRDELTFEQYKVSIGQIWRTYSAEEELSRGKSIHTVANDANAVVAVGIK